MGESIYSKSRSGRPSYRIASGKTAQPQGIPPEYLREGPIGLPEVSARKPKTKATEFEDEQTDDEDENDEDYEEDE